MTDTSTIGPEDFNAAFAELLPGVLGIRVETVALDRLEASMPVTRQHMAPNGFLHAGAVVTLVDSLCGFGTVVNLPPGATGFTTIELKSNFLGTATDGTVRAVATPLHRGRTTQVWDAEARHDETGKVMAHFRCTQMVLWPKT